MRMGLRQHWLQRLIQTSLDASRSQRSLTVKRLGSRCPRLLLALRQWLPQSLYLQRTVWACRPRELELGYGLGGGVYGEVD
jgi:hypothetical protein